MYINVPLNLFTRQMKSAQTQQNTQAKLREKVEGVEGVEGTHLGLAWGIILYSGVCYSSSGHRSRKAFLLPQLKRFLSIGIYSSNCPRLLNYRSSKFPAVGLLHKPPGVLLVRPSLAPAKGRASKRDDVALQPRVIYHRAHKYIESLFSLLSSCSSTVQKTLQYL